MMKLDRDLKSNFNFTKKNNRFLFNELALSDFGQIIPKHNEIITVIDQTPIMMSGNLNFVMQFFIDREFYWVGSEVIGPSTDLGHQDLFYYDLMQRETIKFEMTFDQSMFSIVNIFSMFHKIVNTSGKLLDKTSFQFSFKEENNQLKCDFICFRSIDNVD